MMLPAPSDIAANFIDGFASGIYWQNLQVTLFQALSGFALACDRRLRALETCRVGWSRGSGKGPRIHTRPTNRPVIDRAFRIENFKKSWVARLDQAFHIK